MWKLGVVVVLLGAAGFFGYRHRQETRAEEAVVASVCASELDVLGFRATSDRTKAENDVVGGAALSLKIKADFEASSLVPHLATLRRLSSDDVIGRSKRLAAVAAARCPDVFPEVIKAEKPVGYTFMFSTWTEPN